MNCAKPLRLFCLVGAAGLSQGLLPLAAQADPLDRVEVSGQRLRGSVKAACPDIVAQLGSQLGDASARYTMNSDYRVEFMLQGRQILAAQALGGRQAGERSAIRQAVRRLDCADAAPTATPQRFVFRLSVRQEEAQDPPALARFSISEELQLASR